MKPMSIPKLATIAAAMMFAVVLVAPAASIPTTDLTNIFRERGIEIDGLRVVEVSGIVVIRGKTTERREAEEAGLVAQRLGYKRVANLVRIVEPVDDAAIERSAERVLTIHRSLDGCQFGVSSRQGVVRLFGRVRHELQKDVALQLVRNIDGVREVHADLDHF